MRNLGGDSFHLAVGVGLAIAWLELALKLQLVQSSIKPCFALLPLFPRYFLRLAGRQGQLCQFRCASGSLREGGKGGEKSYITVFHNLNYL